MEQELQKNARQAEMEVYGQLLSQASTVWGNMTAMVKNLLVNKVLLIKLCFVQQGIAIAQGIISTELAAAKALELGPVLGIPAAAVVRGLGYASVGLIAAQTIAGFSDGGYTGNGLKHTPAGIVHKGEVVWSQDDIKRWGGVGVVESMRTSSPGGYANGGYVSNNQSDAIAIRRESRQFEAINSNQSQLNTNEKPINVYVTVNADGSSKTETKTIRNNWAK